MAAHRLPGRLTSALAVRRLNRENHQLTCQLVALTRQLDEAGIELSGAREDRRAADAKTDRTAGLLADAMTELHTLRADLANRNAITVAAWIRPIEDAQDVSTQPTNVTSLQERGAA